MNTTSLSPSNQPINFYIFKTTNFSKVHVHHSVLINDNNLVTIQLLTVESPVAVAICNIQGHVVPTFLDRSGMPKVVVRASMLLFEGC